MRVPLWLRTSADSHAGSYLVELRERSYFNTLPNASCCTKICHIVQRIFAMLKVQILATTDCIWMLIQTFAIGSCQCLFKPTATNALASIALVVFAFGMPFGHIPKVHYTRRYTIEPRLNLPQKKQSSSDAWHNLIESNPMVIEIISRADEYESITALEDAIRPHLPLADEYHQLGREIGSTTLYIAYENKLNSLVHRLFQLGMLVNTLVPTRPAPLFWRQGDIPKKSTLLAQAASYEEDRLLSFLLSKNADPNESSNGFTALDNALISNWKISYSFPDANIDCYRLHRWWANQKTIQIANKLIRAGAKFNRHALEEYFVEVQSWRGLSEADMNARRQANLLSPNPFVQRYQYVADIIPQRVHDYAMNLRNNVLPYLEKQ